MTKLKSLVVDCNVHIRTLANVSRRVARCIVNDTSQLYRLDKTSYRYEIDYPLSRPYPTGTIKFNGMWNHNLGDILWQLAQHYKRIYKQARKFGVWGHAFDDLVFEGLSFTKAGKLIIYVGS